MPIENVVGEVNKGWTVANSLLGHEYLRDGELGAVASISKLYWSEYHQHAVDLALSILGADALVREGRRPYKHFRTDEPQSVYSSNSWIDVFLFNARSGTVYAGTSEIQRNILAESILGLPREPMIRP